MLSPFITEAFGLGSEPHTTYVYWFFLDVERMVLISERCVLLKYCICSTIKSIAVLLLLLGF